MMKAAVTLSDNAPPKITIKNVFTSWLFKIFLNGFLLKHELEKNVTVCMIHFIMIKTLLKRFSLYHHVSNETFYLFSFT